MQQSIKTGKLVVGLLKKHWIILVGLFASIVLSSALSAITPMIFQKVIDGIATLDFQVLLLYVLAIVAIPFLVTLLDVGKTKLSFTLTNHVSRRLRRDLYEHMLNIKMREFSRDSVQGFLYSITRYVGKLCDVFLGGDVLNFLANTVQILTAFAFLLLLDWMVAIGCIVVIPLLFLLIKSQRSRVDKKESTFNDVMREGENTISETLRNMKIVRMFGGKEHEQERFASWQQRNISAGWSVRFTHALAVKILPNSVEQMMYGVVFVFCIVSVLRGTMTAGTLVAVLSYVPLFYRSMSGLLSVQIGLSAVAKPVRELDKIFAMERETGTEALEADEVARFKDPALLRFSQVFFTYGRVVCNVAIPELSIRRGELIAIVGESGGGKTTIFDLICKFFDPNEGELYFMGRRIRSIAPDALRRYIALMPQESLLWNGDLACNIAYPEQAADEEKLERTMHAAALCELHKRLAASDDTAIGEYGNRISGGEKQRLSLARALYKDALLYLLDEPTSLMDSITAERVFQNIRTLTKENKTVLMVTHNLSHARYADRVLVCKDSRIEGFDTYENLMASCEYFASLIKSYSSGDDKMEAVQSRETGFSSDVKA